MADAHPRRRLLNINNYAYRRGGAETVFMEHTDMFQGAGWDVDVFSMKHPENTPELNDEFFAELIDLEHMSGAAAKLKSAGMIVFNFDAREKLKKLIARKRPDIAHAHNIYHHLSPSILPVLKSEGVPILLTAHDLKLACPSYKMLSNGAVCERCKGGNLWNAVSQRCLKSSLPLSGLVAVESSLHRALGLYRNNLDKIVAPSRFYKAKLEEWGWPAYKVEYIPNFVSDDPVTPGNGGSGAILYFGRLSDEKGLATLIRAAASASVPVNIAGTGPIEPELRRMAEALNAPVKFLGYQRGQALSDLIASAEAVVLPSEWYENAPMSVLESYLHGRPVAGADIGGIPELITEGETGWLFESGNVQALAGTLTKVLGASPGQRSEMGMVGRDLVRRDFGRDAYRSRTEQLYQRLLA